MDIDDHGAGALECVDPQKESPYSLFAWGSSGYGQLGFSSAPDEEATESVNIPSLAPWYTQLALSHGCVTQIACGLWHSLFLVMLYFPRTNAKPTLLSSLLSYSCCRCLRTYYSL